MSNIDKMLLDNYPLIIFPKLAVTVGLNEAIVLQQINYWLHKSNKVKDGKYWTYGSYEYWSEQFPFWSVSTIRRTLTNLENKNLIETANYNKAGFDKTKWYTINYDVLESMSIRCVQNEQTSCSKRTDELFKMSKPIPKTSSNTSSNKEPMSGKPNKKPSGNGKKENVYKVIITHLNERTGRNFSPTNKATQSQINARMSEGRTVDDFKAVIDLKTEQWKDDSKMSNYLRPSTLFAPTNFENYVNEALAAKPKNQPVKREEEQADFNLNFWEEW